MKTTIKVAELATIIYAILFFGSLCIQMSYFSLFGISICSYMTYSEVFFLFLNMPMMYFPIIVSCIIIYFGNITHLNIDNENCSLSNKKQFIKRINWIISLTSYITILFISEYYQVIEKSALLSILIFIIPCWNTIQSHFRPYHYHSTMNMVELYNSVREKLGLQPKHIALESILAHNFRYLKSQGTHIINIYNNKVLYIIILFYFQYIIGLSVVNCTRADSYIKQEKVPRTQAIITTDDSRINCNNYRYLYVGDSASYIFIYDTLHSHTIVISKNNVKRIDYTNITTLNFE